MGHVEPQPICGSTCPMGRRRFDWLQHDARQHVERHSALVMFRLIYISVTLIIVGVKQCTLLGEEREMVPDLESHDCLVDETPLEREGHGFLKLGALLDELLARALLLLCVLGARAHEHSHAHYANQESTICKLKRLHQHCGTVQYVLGYTLSVSTISDP